MIWRAVALLALVSVLGACAGFQALLRSPDYGAYPENYESLVRRYFAKVLIDPRSARFRIGEPYKGRDTERAPGGAEVRWYGYLIDVRINARNDSGSYTGFKPYVVQVRDGVVRKIRPARSVGAAGKSARRRRRN